MDFPDDPGAAMVSTLLATLNINSYEHYGLD